MTAAEIRAMLRRSHDAIGQCDDCQRDSELWDGGRKPGDSILPLRCRRCWTAEAKRAAEQGRAIEGAGVRLVPPESAGAVRGCGARSAELTATDERNGHDSQRCRAARSG